MGTLKIVEPGEEIYEGETRKLGDLQTALAKIPACVNYRRLCETLASGGRGFLAQTMARIQRCRSRLGDRV